MVSHLRTYFTHKQSIAVGMVFISMGFLFGNWATLIPFIKQKYDLNDAELGLLLLSMPFGATAMNPLTTLIINKFGMRSTTFWGLLMLLSAYVIPTQVNHILLVSAGLVLVGFGIAITNVAMNTCATALEHQYKINIMSTCHGMFSAGLMFGSIIASILIGMKLSAGNQSLLVSGMILLIAILVRPIIMKIHEEKIQTGEGGKKFSFPKGALLWMVVISMCTNITEGTMADWSAVYMRDVVKTNDYFIGWGLAGYSMFMALGRFLGDALIPRYGGNKVIQIGGIIAALGIVLSVVFPYTSTSIIGFALVGAGVSCGAPILYGASARVPGMAKGAGLAIMNTFSMGGFLAGPVLIGFISKALSLPIAFMIIASLAILWSLLSGKTKL